jgi:beta-ribofuranosylaminobenzene 5'-phosphate synthase
MTRVRIRTASRLHFGLLGWGPRAIRQFGGVGLTIEDPGIDLIAEPARQWSFEGPLADRVRNIVHLVQERGSSGLDTPIEFAPAKLRVVAAPPEHVGLGVGTQLSLAVVRALWELASVQEPSVEGLARLSGRGRRSGIGLHGFLRGGLIVDGGRRDEVRPPPLVANVSFPEDWSILTVQPPGPRGRHGPDEIQAFADLPPLTEPTSDQLCRLVLLGIVPSVVERDLPAFGEAVHELQMKVGAAFAPVQGGIFASPRSEAIIADMGRQGLVGAGQSSWGPTLFAFGILSESDQACVTGHLVDEFGMEPSRVNWTRAANHGALLTRLS